MIANLLSSVRDEGFWVKPVDKLKVCSDPDDNIFLECAQAAEADYLVTGNLRHFPISWQGTKIVTSRIMLDTFIQNKTSDPE